MRKTFVLFAMFFSVSLLAQPSHRAKAAEGVVPLIEALTHSVVPAACSDVPTLYCNTTRAGSLGGCFQSPYYLDLYLLSGTAGQTLTINGSTTTSYQILVTVQDYTTGTVLASNYGPTAKTVYTFPTTATYVVGVGFIAQFATGPYTLVVTCQASTMTQCQFSGTVNEPSTMSAQLLSSDTACSDNPSQYFEKVYRLNVNKGDLFSVSMSGDFPAWVGIYRPADKTWLVAQSELLGTAAFFEYEAQATEQVNLWISSDSTTPMTGNFTVRFVSLAGECRKRAVVH